MKYLGPARNDNGRLQMPDSFGEDARAATYEALDIGGDILLVPSPLDRKRLEHIDALARASIEAHRKALEGLAR